MSKIFKVFVDSAKEFKNVKSLVTAALLLALHTVLACFISIQVTNSLRISISFLTNVVTGYLFGPVMGLVCGGLGDIIGFVVKPTGPYFYGWTLNAALAGFIYGCFFYGRSPKTIPVFKKDKKSSDDSKETVKEKTDLFDILALISIIAGIVVWFVMPFYKVTLKDASVVNYSGFGALKAVFGNGQIANVAIVSGLLLAGCIVAIVSFFLKLKAIPIFVTIFTSFIGWLSVYTDKKTVGIKMGFYVFILISLVYVFALIVKLLQKHSVDIKFFTICVIGMVLDTFIVNVILGTYWVSLMYGKGFNFYLTSRLVKNLIQLPVNIIMVYYILGFMGKIKSKIIKK